MGYGYSDGYSGKSNSSVGLVSEYLVVDTTIS